MVLQFVQVTIYQT